MCVTNFDKSLDFWTSYFNFKPTDVMPPQIFKDLAPAVVIVLILDVNV